MLRSFSISAVAAGALTLAGPAFAQAHGHGGSPAGAATGAGMVSQGPMNASPTGVMNASPNSGLSGTISPTTTGPTVPTTSATPRTAAPGTSYNSNSPALQNSEGPANASPTGISHANQNSVLARGAVSASSLQGLNTGMTVNSSTGTSIGTVSRIITGPNNTIRAVVVTSSTGQTYTLPPSSLSISGGVVTTTTTPH